MSVSGTYDKKNRAYRAYMAASIPPIAIAIILVSVAAISMLRFGPGNTAAYAVVMAGLLFYVVYRLLHRQKMRNLYVQVQKHQNLNLHTAFDRVLRYEVLSAILQGLFFAALLAGFLQRIFIEHKPLVD